MTRKEACKILGILPDISEADLKKQYRSLMQKVHPDAAEAHNYPYEANDINVAYEFLLEHLHEKQKRENRRTAKRMAEHIKWNAPINPNAFAEREIYQYCEDQDGQRIGIVTLDWGKYIWTTDEDFPLFLKSLYKLSKDIITEDDVKKGINRDKDVELLADIAYLLAGQFFSTETTLSLMKKEVLVGTQDEIYYTRAMLEPDVSYDRERPRKKTEKKDDYNSKIRKLMPAYVRNHRLYVCDCEKNLLGYLTFKDDRLPFGIVPLFERQAVQLKLEYGEKWNDVHLWMKLIPEKNQSVDSVTLKIQNALDKGI